MLSTLFRRGVPLWWRCLCATALWAASTLGGVASAGGICSYALSGAGNASVDGCYVAAGQWGGAPLYEQQQKQRQQQQQLGRGEGGGLPQVWQLFQYEGVWRLGVPGVVALYSASCASVWPPPAADWAPYSSTAAAPPPAIASASASTPVGSCAAPPPVVGKNCSCAACRALWGPQHNGTCPDLHTVAPDLVRPVMLADGTPPGPGLRVKAVEPSFAGTQAYHALYLPEEWTPPAASFGDKSKQATGDKQQQKASLWPVIVEYMGNGPWHDDAGDSSSGRPEDSNLGYGISAGRGYIWISMPFLTSNMGNETNIST
jgi:hypothetical protein